MFNKKPKCFNEYMEPVLDKNGRYIHLPDGSKTVVKVCKSGKCEGEFFCKDFSCGVARDEDAVEDKCIKCELYYNYSSEGNAKYKLEKKL